VFNMFMIRLLVYFRLLLNNFGSFVIGVVNNINNLS